MSRGNEAGGVDVADTLLLSVQVKAAGDAGEEWLRARITFGEIAVADEARSSNSIAPADGELFGEADCKCPPTILLMVH